MNKKNKLIKVVAVGALSLFSTQLYAQNLNLIVQMTDNSTQTFLLSDIRSIKFNIGALTINENDNTSTSFNIIDIDNYHFEDKESSLNQYENEKNTFVIYPNPAQEVVNIVYESVVEEDLSIDVLDASGKIVKQIFKGKNQGKTQFQWEIGTSENIPSGSYICRITTNDKLITKPIIIK